jgi:hypothetical protein
MKQPLVKLMKVTELGAGIGVFICGLSIFLYLFLGLSTANEPHLFSAILLGILFLVAPGLFVALGCYFQTMRGQVWAIVLLLIGAISNFVITMRVGALFVYIGGVWGLWAVWLGLALLFVTITAAVAHTVWDLLNLLSRAALSRGDKQ